MAWNSFLKNILGGDDSDDVATLPDDGSPRNLNLSGRDFKQQLNDTPRAALLDVRTPAEFGSGSIPGARNIDFFAADFGQKISKLDKDTTYFVFCRSGNRSAQACKMMHKLGFDVRNLSGGVGSFPG
ncbi:MAG: rhodanese-like domain-containing protein [Saprospiraceae bacterium]